MHGKVYCSKFSDDDYHLTRAVFIDLPPQLKPPLEELTTRQRLPAFGAFSSPAHAVITSFGMQCARSAGVGRVLGVFLLGPLLYSTSQRAWACPLASSRRRRSPGPLSPSVRFLTDASRRAPMDKQWRFGSEPAVFLLPALPWPPLPRELSLLFPLVACLRAHARAHASAATTARPPRPTAI